MLILVLIDVQYIQNVGFSFEKDSNGQNHSWSDSNLSINLTLPIAKFRISLILNVIWKTLDNWRVSYSLLNL